MRFPLLAGLTAVLCAGAWGQTDTGNKGFQPQWRRIGNAAIEVSLASLATGPVERVWYSEDGERAYVRLGSGKVLRTEDFETFQEAALEEAVPPETTSSSALRLPEPGAIVQRARDGSPTLYALGRAVYRSEDGGLNWMNLTEYRRQSILGDGLADLAVSPRDENEILAAGRFGVWRSKDGGLSWSGLNDFLPNLPVRRLLRLPGEGEGTRLLLKGIGEFEWVPGERTAWRPARDSLVAAEEELRQRLSAAIGTRLGAVAAAGDFFYAAAVGEARIWASPDRGRSWRTFAVAGAGPVERLYALESEPQVCLAALGQAVEGGAEVHVLRTTNGGIFWDDLTANLPPAAARGITAHLATGAVYVATDRGAFFTVVELLSAGPPTAWTPLTEGLTTSAVVDVRLDPAGNQLYIAVDGEGVYATVAPHRFLAPAVVNSADWRTRAASPGVLLSILGRKIQMARAGDYEAPILAAADGESQIQVPFEATGPVLSMAFAAAVDGGRLQGYAVGLPLLAAAPAIFVDRDGTPMILDADSGVLLDAMTPARPGGRVQVLATGLGRVKPDWPTGMPAPLEDPPSVIAPVKVYLDRMPVEVTRAVLAPGYIGFYLVEFEVPEIVNAGPAELYIEAGGRASNRTRLYLEP